MSNEAIIDKIKEYVKQQLQHDASGHDWWHIYRVCNIAKHIAAEEKANIFIVELAALLHDLPDWKLEKSDSYVSPKEIERLLKNLNCTQNQIFKTCEIVENVSFKGAKVPDKKISLECQIVQDADRLDALGAIGIARALTYGGMKQRELYDPDKKPVLHTSFDEYKNHVGTTINHFHEKLLLLKERMHTKTAKQLAENRHQIMVTYLEQFEDEWSSFISD